MTKSNANLCMCVTCVKERPIAPCQSCGQDACIQILNLGTQPICNKFLNSKGKFATEHFYPLHLNFCQNCKLVQLDCIPPAEEVFDKDFSYLTGSTPESIACFERLAKDSIKRFNLKPKDFILDIGSNDGTVLRHFKDNGMPKVLGIDPAPKPASIANSAGIETINAKFEDGIDAILQKTDHRIKLVMALNVIAHTDTIHPFLEGVKRIMSQNDATFISMSHYLPNLIDAREYDMVYHEHARYYSITSLMYLFGKHGLFIYDAEEVDLLGGAIVVYAGLKSKAQTKRLRELLEQEKPLMDIKTYQSFNQAVMDNGWKLYQLIMQLKKEGKKIAGIGAPMKSSTLLNFCNINDTMLDYITEVNPLKIGTYTPGTHIKVVEESRIFQDKPDVCLILSWNMADRIIKSLKEKGYKGSFIIPIPSIMVIE